MSTHHESDTPFHADLSPGPTPHTYVFDITAPLRDQVFAGCLACVSNLANLSVAVLAGNRESLDQSYDFLLLNMEVLKEAMALYKADQS